LGCPGKPHPYHGSSDLKTPVHAGVFLSSRISQLRKWNKAGVNEN
jgi:hypothetical protein